MGRSRRRRCTAWSRIDWGSTPSTYASLATPRTSRLSPPMRGSAGQTTPRGDLSDLEGCQRAEDRGWAIVTEGPSYRTRNFGSALNPPERGVDHVGPNGSPSQYHARNTRIQAIMVHHVYGSISATMVPTPALFSYRCANPTTNARYGFSGLMTLVGESLTR